MFATAQVRFFPAAPAHPDLCSALTGAMAGMGLKTGVI